MSKRRIVRLVSYVWLLAAVSSSAATTPADSEFSLGVNAYRQGKYAEAAAHFEQAVKQGKKTADCHVYLGHSYVGAGKRDAAINKYREIIASFPGSPAAGIAQTSLANLDSRTRSAESSPYTAQSAAIVADASLDPTTPNLSRVFYKSQADAMVFDCKINGRPVQMDFDTGAPSIVIDKATVSSIGLPVPTGEPDGENSGSSNSVNIPYWNMQATVQVGPIIKRNVHIKVYERMSTMPLLGQSFFKDFTYTIDGNAHCVEFRKRGGGSGSAQTSAGYVVPFTFRTAGNRIVVEVEVNGRKGPMMLDTGNSACGISFETMRQMKNYGVTLPPDAQAGTSTGVSGSGNCYRFHLNRVKLGPIEKTNVSADVNTDVAEADEEMPLVGQEMLAGWQYTIDTEKRQLHFLRR